AIRSVLGNVKSEEVWGWCLPHEHLIIDYGELLKNPKQVPEKGSDLERRLISSMRALLEIGGGLLVDCTPPGYGRYPDLLAKVSRESGVHIVACTGGFTEQWAPLHPVVTALDEGALAEWFVRELSEGMGGTRYRAGAIKVATGEGRISDGEARIFRAAARAHRRTEAPIITHTTAGLGPEQVKLLESEGADPSKIIVGHMGFEEDPKADIRRVLERGANVAFDRVGHRHFFPDEHWVDLTLFVLDLGYRDSLLLSHDAVTEFFGPQEIAAHTFSDYTHLHDRFLPILKASCVDAATLDSVTRENPLRIFAYRAEEAAS
ncbi:MAG: phosphotriesterase family protein, partial [Gammaproteobacteria bacterium]